MDEVAVVETSTIMDTIVDLVDYIDGLVWGVPMIVILLGSHIFLTIRTGFIQRKIPLAIKLSVTKDPDAEGDISQFGALCTALSATIGTGNIVGVGTAVALGGPGAVFWVWITGVFGIATKYAETFASVKYRVKDHKGNMLGGAMYAWRRAFERKDGSVPWWALLGAGAFALFAAIASFGIGSAVQSSALTSVIIENVPALENLKWEISPGWEIGPEWVIGLLVVIAVALVIFGGVKVLSRVCEKLVPFMAIAYALGCITILIINAQYLGEAIALIFQCAFTNEAAFGGAVGSGVMLAIRYGCARGLFSNESGMGSAPLVAAAATTRNPARQSLVSMTGTFWDTVVVCALTGLVIVSTIISSESLQGSLLEAAVAGESYDGAALTSAAFALIPYVGTPILVFGMITFAYSTILGWSYYGNRCITYLFGKHAIRPYQVLYVIIAFLGAIGIGDLAWNLADIANALMVLPNIIVVLLLSGLIYRETKHFVYEDNLMEKVEEELPVLESK